MVKQWSFNLKKNIFAAILNFEPSEIPPQNQPPIRKQQLRNYVQPLVCNKQFASDVSLSAHTHYLIRPLGNERVYLPLYKVSDTPFISQWTNYESFQYIKGGCIKLVQITLTL